MKLSISWRSGCLRWASPFVFLLGAFYYISGEEQLPSSFHGYAPSIVAAPLVTLYAIAYAITAALAAWESGRLTSAGIWQLAPARSRFRIAANVLLPVVMTSWVILLVPPAISLIRASTFPTLGSLRLPAMALCLCVAHAVIGFAIGRRTPRVFAVPIVAIVDFVLVGFTRSVDPYWLRHVSGQYADLSFGEVPAFASIVAPLLFAGGLAGGVTLLWTPTRSLLARALAACFVAALGTSTAYHITSDWGHSPALVGGQAPVTCLGQAPRICMPTASSTRLPAVRKELLATLATLRTEGVAASPQVIRDRLGEGREYRRSTDATWYISLTSAAESGTVRYQAAMAAVRFPCRTVESDPAHAAMLWVASVVGEQKRYSQFLTEQAMSPQETSANRQIQSVVKSVLTQPVAKQTAWYKNTLTSACGGSVR
ncbi:hypothetical protein ACFC09_11280 [Streptomyces sp. NPDC056161]|uniref:hypothetical protein n=1 Tax=Streptomyces sp. NPDC056161 TaxID=3345732 RepID=UPI0035DA0EFB